MRVKHITPRMIFDSRGLPTVECDIWLHDGSFGRASVPSGASTGKREALELRDNDVNFFHGKGVEKALRNITKIIAPQLLGHTFKNYQEFDAALLSLDNTPRGEKLGANAILPLSLAFAKAYAMSLNVELYELFGEKKAPRLMMNVINGGQHADNNLDIQEFMIVPVLENLNDDLRAGAEIYQALKAVMKSQNLSTAVGDEGGFAPQLRSTAHALDLILQAIEKAGYEPSREVSIALDVAASELYSESQYKFTREGKERNTQQLLDFYQSLFANYPMMSIEDGMAENDIDGWQRLTASLGPKLMVVGDDVFVTNQKIFAELAPRGVANAILIKPNQIGTLTETLAVIELAKSKGYRHILSHRSGETEDTTIAHLAVGTGASFMKAGAMARTDRLCKYNELIRILE